MTPSPRGMVAATVLGGETASLLDVPKAASGSRAGGNALSRAFETGGQPYTAAEERVGGGGPAGPSEWTNDGLRSYHAQPPPTHRAAPSRDRNKTAKTRFPSLTPAPGSFRASGDTRASEAVAHARKTWAAPALRTQAVASYGAVPDLEVIPEDAEVKRFHMRERVRRYTDLGCPSCTIS